MTQLPRIIKNMNLFVDGVGMAGFIETLTTPTLALQMEEHRAGGMDIPVELDMGMDKLECSFELSEPNETAIRCLGFPGKLFIARSAIQRDGEAALPYIVNMTGTLKSMDPGGWQVGQKNNHTFSIALTYYKLSVAGAEIVEIDAINMIRKINGEDQVASIRSAIGI